MRRGVFITLEGGEGCGKSTQARRLAAWLGERGVRTLPVREPGGSPLPEAVRSMLKRGIDGDTPCDRAELLLFLAARAQLVEKVIIPALESGVWVVSDRFSDSTAAYQGAGRGLDADFIKAANGFACAGLSPDLTILLELPRETALRRICARKAAGGAGDRIEDENEAFHSRIAAAFRAIAASEPGRVATIDASGTPEEVFAAVSTVVQKRFFASVPGAERS